MSKKNTDPIVKLLSILCPMIYFASYLTRKNYGIVMEAVISAEGVTNAQAGLVETLALISYGAGQIISGILGDKFKPQNVILCGLSATTVCNLLMPFAPNMTFRAAIWFINGFAQSMLWRRWCASWRRIWTSRPTTIPVSTPMWRAFPARSSCISLLRWCG